MSETIFTDELKDVVRGYLQTHQYAVKVRPLLVSRHGLSKDEAKLLVEDVLDEDLGMYFVLLPDGTIVDEPFEGLAAASALARIRGGYPVLVVPGSSRSIRDALYRIGRCIPSELLTHELLERFSRLLYEHKPLQYAQLSSIHINRRFFVFAYDKIMSERKQSTEAARPAP